MQAPLEELSGSGRLILIAANPRAGARSSQKILGRLSDALAKQGFEVRVITDLHQLAETAAAANSEGRLRTVVAAGGDGTLMELVNRTPENTPLSIFPLGTANLLANYLGLRPAPIEFAAMLAAGHVLRIDAARATFETEPAADISPRGPSTANPPLPRSRERIFLIVAGLGFDAAVVERLHAVRSGHIQMWDYAKPIVQSLRSYTYPELRCECALESPHGLEVATPIVFSARWLFVQNLPCYAGGLRFAPAADPQDGLLDICALAGGSFWNAVRYLGYIWAGKHQELPDCRMLRARRLRITCDTRVPVQFDGDPAGATPLEIEALPARIRLVAPISAVGRLAASGAEMAV